jgi:poly(3-hydroxybutyrate) depolymerase
MNTYDRTVACAMAGLGTSLLLSGTSAQVNAQPGQGRGRFGPDPRAEVRMYHFEDTNEDLPYCLFVSSKIDKDTPTPLIISLHGLGAGPQIMCNSTAVDLADRGGYILAAPMGYNTGGWYGSPTGFAGRGGNRGRGANAGRGGNNAFALSFDAINQADKEGNRDDHLTRSEIEAFFGQTLGGEFIAGVMDRWDANKDGVVTRQEFDERPAFAGRGRGGFGGGNQPENLAELSEKDVMNVLAMVRKEFNVDDDRIYLTGHSMGGAGTYFLGSKHAGIWAAIAPVAPAAFSMMQNRAEYLQPIKDAGVPIMVVHGDQDEAVPVQTSRDWVATMKEMDIEHEYVELPGVTHGPVITVSQEHIYKFFDKHSK